MSAYYICKQCGYAFPKKDKQEAIDLDYEDSTYGLDVHCPQCGATTNQLKETKQRFPKFETINFLRDSEKQKSRNHRAIDRMRLGNQF